MSVGHESEASEAMEAVGQRVQQEAANELVGLQVHDFDGAVLTIILPCEGDGLVVEGLDAAIGNGDAMGIAPR